MHSVIDTFIEASKNPRLDCLFTLCILVAIVCMLLLASYGIVWLWKKTDAALKKERECQAMATRLPKAQRRPDDEHDPWYIAGLDD